MIPPSEITILWSTQGGRAKACARRTSRILRDYYYNYFQQQQQQQQQQQRQRQQQKNDNENNHDISMLNYYGTSFDDFGAVEFLKLGLGLELNGAITTTDSHSRNTCANNKTNKKILLLMFVSTTGDAEHCDCIQETWKML